MSRHPSHVHVTAAAAMTMVLASLCMATMDATSKYLVQKYPATFLVWVRYCVQVAILLIFLGPRMKSSLVRTGQFRLQVLRGALLAAGSLLIVIAFREMPLADAAAINFAAPSIVTILAVVLLGEHVNAARIVSVVAGLSGVLLIVRPGSDVFQSVAIFPLLAACTAATYQVLTRKLAGEDARTMLFYGSAVGAVMITLLVPWVGVAVPASWPDIAAMVAIGVLATAGHFLFIRALQLAPASGLASITYVQLVFLTVIGLVVFNEFPDLWTLAGMLVIIVSGLFLTWYERRRAVVQLTEPPAVD